ncbi:MAG TPA: hypothetical protein VHZ77_06555 [Gaiellaceae bacterium]|jgi:hypothetical protein|nr:hypothetical protein [Gaiellaceae bacterium]
MNHGGGPPWKGRSEEKGDKEASLQAAIKDAWKKAEAGGAPAGTYVVTRIEIETRNPIHAYSVTIDPGP